MKFARNCSSYVLCVYIRQETIGNSFLLRGADVNKLNYFGRKVRGAGRVSQSVALREIISMFAGSKENSRGMRSSNGKGEKQGLRQSARAGRVLRKSSSATRKSASTRKKRRRFYREISLRGKIPSSTEFNAINHPS